ncbi:MAG: adhesin transport system membrane fusion protein [Candidatus Endobugula sp.]
MSLKYPEKNKSTRQPKIDDDDLAYTSSASAAILHQTPKGGQQLLWAIVVFIVVMLTWSSLAYVDEFTRGEGRVIPSQYVQIVQNLEGGIIDEVFVTQGQTVTRGQPLLRLDDKRFSFSLRETEVNQSQLLSKTLRLKAEAEGAPFPEDELTALVSKNVVSAEKALYFARAQELSSGNKVILQQTAQKRQELSEWRAKFQRLRRSYRLLKSELDLTSPLVAQGAVSQVEVLQLRRQLNDVQGEMNAAQLAIPRIESSLSESEQTLDAAESAFRSRSQAEYSEVKSELNRLNESSQAIADQVDRTLVVSPVAGTIKQLFVKTLGGVIQPGRDLVAIVPTEDKLRVEARVSPADIAFMHPKQKAVIKFTAYDFSIHGGLSGEVVNISPDTITDEEGNSFYIVQIETERSFLGTEVNPKPIIAGMTVSVDILTGKKTVLDYILKPILKTKQLALRER